MQAFLDTDDREGLEDGGSRRGLIWATPQQLPLARAVADRAGLRIASLGGPTAGDLRGIAEEMGVEHVDDVRSAIASAVPSGRSGIDLVWLLTTRGLGGGALEADASTIAAAQARGVRVATLEPIPASALDLATGGWMRERHGVAPIDGVRFVPLVRTGRAFRELGDLLGEFGRIRTIGVEACCNPSEGTLGARLFSAMELVHSLMGVPELIESGYGWPGHASALHLLPGDSMRDLEGDLGASLRFADGRVASVLCSNHSGRWDRRIVLLGEGGRMTVTDSCIEWIGPEGETVEHTELDQPQDSGSGTTDLNPARCPAVHAIADSLGRLVDPAVPPDPPIESGIVLAMGQAALLSARTGQGESPAMIHRLAGGDG